MWIEIESDADGAIYVKIDRKRHFPVTSLLRVLGLATDAEMMQKFGKTAARDAISTSLDARPRKIGRRRVRRDLPQRSATATSPLPRTRVTTSKRSFRPSATISRASAASTSTTVSVCRPTRSTSPARRSTSRRWSRSSSTSANSTANPSAEADDIDHLGFRRVRYVGELLEQRMRVGLSRMKRNIQDRMSTIDTETTAPGVRSSTRARSRPRISEFFTTNQLSQFMQQIQRARRA